MSPNDNQANIDSDGWIRKTRLFERARTIHNEIGLHKWYESEKAGHDIGWDRATVDWKIQHGGSGRTRTSTG
jgi:hypothetical protein